MANLNSEERRKRYSRWNRNEDIEQSEANKDSNVITKADERRNRYASKDYLEKYNAYHTPTRSDGSALNRYINAYGLNQQRSADRQQEARSRYNQQQFMNNQRRYVNGEDMNPNGLSTMKTLNDPIYYQRLADAYQKSTGISVEQNNNLERLYGNDRRKLKQAKEDLERTHQNNTPEYNWIKNKLVSTASAEENEERQKTLNRLIGEADDKLASYADKVVGSGIDNPEYLAQVESIKKEKERLENELENYKDNIDYTTAQDYKYYKAKGDADKSNHVKFVRENSDETIAKYWNDYDYGMQDKNLYNGVVDFPKDEDFIRAITQDEADQYSYLLGKYGEETAEEYLKGLAKHTDVNGAITKMQEAQEQGKKNFWQSTAESIGLGLLTPAEAVKNLAGFGGKYRTYDDYAIAGRQEALRSGAVQAIQDTNLPGSENVLPFLYNTGSSTADNLLRYVVGGAAGSLTGSASVGEGAMRFMMAGQVGDSAMKQALDKGLTDSQAATTAIISAINEELFETISLSELKAMQTVKPSSYKELAKNVGKQLLGEGSEEVFTDIGNAIADDLINGEKSEIRTNIRNYMDQGMSEEEAKKQASVDFAMQLVESGLSGGLSGAAMGGLVTGQQANDLDNQKKFEQLAQNYIDAGLSEEEAYNAAENDVKANVKTVRDRKGNIKKYKGVKKSLVKAIESTRNLSDNLSKIEQEMKTGVADTTSISDAENLNGNIKNLNENLNETENRFNEAQNEYDNTQNEYLNDMQQLLSTEINNTNDYDALIAKTDELAKVYPEKRVEISNAVSQVYGSGRDSAAVINELKETNTSPVIETSLKPQINASEEVVANNAKTETLPQKMEFKAAVDGNEGVITSVNKNNITIKDATGNEQTVAIKDAQMSEGAMAAVEQAKQYGVIGSRLYLENLMSDNLRNYTVAFNSYYNAGKQGKSFYGLGTFGLMSNTRNNAKVKELLREVYDAGVRDNSKATKQGGLIRNDARYTIQESEARVLDAVGKAFNVTIQMDHMLSHDANGYLSDDVIHISTSAEKPSLVVFSHEFTHRLEDTSPEAYKAYKDYVIDYLKKTSDEEGNNVYETREIDLKNAYARQGVELSDKELQDELVANATESFLSDTDFIEDLVKENKSLAQQILDVLKQMLEDLKNVFAEKYDAKSKEGKALQDDLKAREEALKLWTNAIKNQNKQAVKKNDTRYSMKELETNYDNLAKEYEEAVKEDDEELMGDLEADLSDIVEEYAKKKGFDTLVYHGTQDFGFTKIDTNMSDDKLSFFATDSLEIANSYSDAISEDSYVRKISDKSSNLGNYEFYANTNNFYEVDAHGQNWNQLRINDNESLLEDINELHNLMKNMDPNIKLEEVYENLDGIADAVENYLTEYAYEAEESFTQVELNRLEQLSKRIDKLVNEWNKTEHYDENGEEQTLYWYLKENKPNYMNTRQIAEMAKNQGYDGVLYKNVHDDGGQSYESAPLGNVYNFFNPQQQVKSADAVTYDDKGNVIPLSERFNKSNDDIRYSLKEQEKNDTASLITRTFDDGSSDTFIKLTDVSNITDEQWDKLYSYADTRWLPVKNPQGLKNTASEAIEKNGAYILETELDKKNDIYKAAKILNLQPKNDADGNKLSEQQQEYFKDSIIRDNNGKLKVVYHGSPNDFTQFDYKYIGNTGSAEGYGFYFTDEKDKASGYTKAKGGKIFEGYLNLTNPLSLKKKTLKRSQVSKLIKKLDPTGDDILTGYDSTGEGYPSKTWYNNALKDALDALMTNDSDADIIAEIANVMGTKEILSTVRKVLGYDGFIAKDKYDNGEVYVVFDSNQFKNVDNKKPTDNPDIRFSLKEDLDYEKAIRYGELKNKSNTELEVEYDKAVKEGNKTDAELIVRRYAKNKGYTTELYHGTQQFGFTKMDVNKSDDNISVFATSSNEMASSYSGTNRIRQVNETSPLSDEERLKLLKDSGIWKDVRYFKANDEKQRLDYLKEQLKRMNSWAKQNVKMLYDRNLMSDYKKFSNNLAEGILFQTIDVEQALKELEPLQNAHFVISDYAIDMWYALQLLRGSNVKKSWFYLDGRFETPGRIGEYNVVNDNAGNYHLYANTDGMLDIDAQGANWNDILGWHRNYIKSFDLDNTYLKKEGDLIVLYSNNGIKLLSKKTSDELSDELKKDMLELFVDIESRKEPGNSTRQIVKYAKDAGYTGVIYRNLYDDGGRNTRADFIDKANVYAFFNPQEQLKSADAVTYDDKGNVIPLSERFNKKNDDIRYSLKEDSEGRKLSEQQQEFFKDSKAVDDEGRLKVVYHGSDNYGFTVFDSDYTDDKRSLFFTDDIDTANSYTKNTKNVYKLYLNLKNPLIIDAKGNKWFNIRLNDSENEVIAAVEDYVDILNGYDDAITVGLVVESLGNLEDSLDYLIEDSEGYFDDLPETVEKLKELAKKIDKFDSNWNPEEHLDEYGEETYLDDFIRYNRSKTYTTREISKIAEEKGHDGVIINNVYDNGKYSIEHHRQGFGTVYIALNSNQIKSVENKKPTDNPDIRFSLKEESNIDRNTVAAVTGKDPYMAEAVKDLEDIMRMKGGEAFFRANQRELYKIYDEIAKEYNIKDYSKKTFAENMNELFDYIQSVDNPDGIDTTMLAMQISNDMLENGSIIDTTMEDMYPMLQQQLRNYKIKIANQDKADLDAVGGYNAFRKQYFGNLTLSNEGTEVDTVYEDLAASYPELFPEDIVAPGYRLMRIADVVDMFKRTVDHIEGATREESAFIIAQDIINKAVLEQTKNNKSIDNKKRLKAQEKVRKQNTNLKKAKKDIHDDYIRLQNKVKALESINERLDRQLTKAENELGRQKKEFADWAAGKRQVNKEDKYYKQRYDKLMQEFSKKKVAELQKKYSAERRKNIEKIRKMVKELDRSVRRPDKNHYVPPYLVKSMLDVLRTIDLDSGYRKPDGSETLVYMKLKDMQKQYQEMQNDPDYTISSEYNETIDKAIGRLADITRGRRINELLDKDIADIVEVMEIINYQLKTARQLLENEKLDDIKDASAKARQQIKDSNRVFNADAKFKNLANRYLNNTLSPVRVMKRIEGYSHDGVLSALGEELQQGERKTKLLRQKAYNMLEELYKDSKAVKALEDFRTKKLEYTVDGTKKIILTPDMRAAIYLHSLNEQNTNHLLGFPDKDGVRHGGGMLIPNYHKQTKFVKDNVKVNQAEKYTTVDSVRLSESDMRKIINDMTDYEKRIVELYQQVNDFLAKELNDTTTKLYGFKKAKVKNYFPLIVDKSILNLDSDVLKFDKTLESFGFLKQRVNSAKPIYLEGVMDALERMIDQSSLFSGMAVPSRDFKKVWNYASLDYDEKYDSVKKQAQKSFGGYIDRYVQDLQADLAQARERGTDSGFLNLFSRGKMAAGALTGNISVVLKQAASYPTAAGGVLGYQDLLNGLMPHGQRGKTLEETMKHYTPLYEDRNTAAIAGVNINDMNLLKRRNPKLYYALTGWIEAMDKATVRRLWYASENYVKRNFKYEVGSDAYYEEVAKVWEDTIRKTQPIYDTMNRPEYLRQTNELLKYLMMFKTQAFQNVGIMVENYGEYKARVKDYKKDKSDFNKKELNLATKQLRKSVTSQIIQSIIFTGITALVDATIKHRPDKWADEETGLLTPESLSTKLFDAWTSNVISQLAFGDIIRDSIVNPVRTRITGKEVQRFDISVAPIDAINTIINGLNKSSKYAADGDMDKSFAEIKKVASTASQYGLGLPVNNIENLYNGLKGNINDIKLGKNPLEATNEKQMYNRVFIAYAAGDKAEAERLSKDLDQDKLKTKMVSKLKDEETIQEAADYRYNSDLDKYKAIVDAYVSLGFDEQWVVSAINSVMNKTYDTTGSGEYNSNDLQRAIDISAVQGSKVANELYKEKYDTYKSEGLNDDEAKKKALSSVKSAITNKYKSQYESGTTSQKVKIRDRLCSLRVAGERLYTYDSMKSWNK